MLMYRHALASMHEYFKACVGTYMHAFMCDSYTVEDYVIKSDLLGLEREGAYPEE
jgi:hypothetical protein